MTINLDQYLVVSKRLAKLVFGTKETVKTLSANKMTCVVDCRVPSIIKSMDKSKIYVVTEPELMRSFDYGVDQNSKGIALLMTKYPLNERLLTQAYGRVGRNLTYCVRYKTADCIYDQKAIQENLTQMEKAKKDFDRRQ